MRSAALNGTAQQEQGQSDNHAVFAQCKIWARSWQGTTLAVAEVKTRSAPGFFTATLEQNRRSQTQQGRP